MARLAVSHDGVVLVALSDGGALLFRRDGERVRELEAPEATSVLAFSDQVWLFGAHDEDAWIARFSVEGAPIGERIALPGAAAGGLRPRPSLLGPACALVGRLELRDNLGRLEVSPLDAEVTAAVCVGPRVRIEARGAEARLVEPHRTLVLGLDAPLLGGVALQGGRSALVELEGGDHVLVDLRSGAIMKKLRLEGVRAIHPVAQRGHLLLHSGEDTLSVLDLRFGRALKELHLGREILGVACDGNGDQILLELRGDGGPPELIRSSYASIFGGASSEPRPAREEPARPPEPEPEPQAKPKAAPERSAPPPHLPRPVEPPPFDAAELDDLQLEQLGPRPPLPRLGDAELSTFLADALERVGALARTAVSIGWDSGRISQPNLPGLPFEAEVRAILDRAGGHAQEPLSDSLRRLADVDGRYRARWRPDGLPRRERRAPLEQLAAEVGLSELATDILLVVVAPVLWGELARIYAIVANDPARPLCDELLLGQLLGSNPRLRRDIAAELDDHAPLMRHGLLRARSGRRPFRALEVPEVVVKRICGHTFERPVPGDTTELRLADRALEELRLPVERLRRLLGELSRPAPDPLRLVVRGRTGSGRRSLLAALAARAHRHLGLVEVPLVVDGRQSFAEVLRERLSECALRGWLPCLSGIEQLVAAEPQIRDQARQVIAAHAGPLALRCGLDVLPPIDPGYLTIDLAPLSESERAAAWRESLARHELPVESAELLAARYRVGPGTIERVLARAPRESVLFSVDAAVKQFRHGKIGDVATRIDRLPTWSGTVLPSEIIDSLREFIGRVQQRRVVLERWGFDDVMASSRGLTALFQGGPGTGKSMVAGVIARELGFELYRIDLGRILSKWIGETEKNLAAVFDAAEDGDVVLLFDEADSLFAKRTEIKTSVDRYANVEVNYLLQRLDTFEGIAILTTNFGTSIDPAFKRRLSLRLTFPFPDETQREQLWRVHLPPDLPLAGPVDLAHLAKRYQLSGGYIRNAALRAAYLAAQEHSAVTQEHLERAIKLEYREVGMLTDAGVLE